MDIPFKWYLICIYEVAGKFFQVPKVVLVMDFAEGHKDFIHRLISLISTSDILVKT